MFLSTLWTRVTASTPADVPKFNIRCLYLEIFFAGILGAITTYNSLFAVRLGASDALIGILTAVPALITAVLSIPSARFLERRNRRVAWLLGSLFFMRIGYLVIVVLPLLAPTNAAFWLVIWVIILNIPLALFNNGFNALLAELVPQARRAFVFSRRTIIYSLVVSITLVATGVWLNRVAFPLNFQSVYLIGIVLVMGSQIYLARVKIPAQVSPAVRAPNINAQVSSQTRAPLTPPMRKVIFNTLIYQLGLQVSGPLFVIYYVNNLHADDGMVSLNTAAGTLGVVFGLFLWEAVLRKRSYGWVLRTATLGTWMFPFTVAFSHNFTLIIIANFVVNLLHPAVDLSTLNVILNLSPPEKRTMYLSYFTVAVNVSTFIAPLSAVPLAGLITIPGVMALSAVLRLTGGILFQVNRVPEPAQSGP